MRKRFAAGLLVVFAGAAFLHAQGTAFTYQGRLLMNGAPATGSYDMRFYLRDAFSGGSAIAFTNTIPAVTVSGGAFTVALDFGTGAFTGPARWMAIEVRTNESTSAYTTLSPRQPILATPYAMTASVLNGPLPTTQLTGAVASAQLFGTYAGSLTFNNPANRFTGNGSGLTNLNASQLVGTIPEIRLPTNLAFLDRYPIFSTPIGTPQGVRLYNSNLWLRGNGDYYHGIGWYGIDPFAGDRFFAEDNTIDGPVLFGYGGGALGSRQTSEKIALRWNANGYVGIGTNNPQTTLHVRGTVTANAFETKGAALQFGVNAVPALRLISSSTDAPNIVGGAAGNSIATNVQGVVIAGGGSTNGAAANQAAADFSSVGGGSGNTIGGYAHHATVAGGLNNRVGTFSVGSVISGGEGNALDTLGESYGADHNTIAGGQNNVIRGYDPHSTIGGGEGNSIGGNFGIWASHSTIAGGHDNAISLSANANITGGRNNFIGDRCDYGAVAGGQNNRIEGGLGEGRRPCEHGTIGGGQQNRMFESRNATIAGGARNTIDVGSEYATIAGGENNRVAAPYGFAAGRRANANHRGAFVWGDSTDADVSSTGDNQFVVRATGGANFSSAKGAQIMFLSGAREGDYRGQLVYVENTNTTGNTGPALRLLGFGYAMDGVLNVGVNGTGKILALGNAGGEVANVSHNGTFCGLAFNPCSDRNAKENFAAISPREVLEKVAGLSITRWNFRNETATQHLGPMAQDFHAAFGLGADNKHIATVDADGVALAAIQGLNQKLTDELQRRDAENVALKRQLAELKDIVTTLARKVNGPAQ